MRFLPLLSLCLAAGSAFAETDAGTGKPADAGTDPTYGGKLLERSVVTGDWGGVRNDLAAHGLTLDMNGIYSFQGVAGGGRGIGHQSGNLFSGNLELTLDTGKAGLWKGGFLKLRLEGRVGDSVVSRVGAISPVNNQAVFPLVEGSEGSDAWALSELLFTQFLTEKIGVFGGLVNTTYDDNNPITGDAISNQHFMNMGFLYSPVEAAGIPAVTLGGGIIFIPMEGIRGNIRVIGSEETAGYNPFPLYEGTTFSTEWELDYKLGDRPGGMVIGGLYSINQPRLPSGSNSQVLLRRFVEGEEVETTDPSWAVFWNAHQYLIGNAERGTGIFARFGLSDGNPNPIRWECAAGLGGVGPFPGRKHDRWGLGFYYQKMADGGILDTLRIDRELGGELFYNIAVTPSMNVTLDAQIIDSPLPGVGTSVVLGTRVSLRF